MRSGCVRACYNINMTLLAYINASEIIIHQVSYPTRNEDNMDNGGGGLMAADV